MQRYPRDDDKRDGDTLRAIGEDARSARLALGLTQGALERLSGIDQSTISRLENGLAPGLALRRYARILAVVRPAPTSGGRSLDSDERSIDLTAEEDDGEDEDGGEAGEW